MEADPASGTVGSCMRTVCSSSCLRQLWRWPTPPASATEEVQPSLSINLLHADLISNQRKDCLETFFLKRRLYCCVLTKYYRLSRQLGCNGGLTCFSSQCPVNPCFADTDCLLCPQHAQAWGQKYNLTSRD